MTIAQTFLAQTYAAIKPEWGGVYTFSYDGEFEVVFADGSAVWGNEIWFREGKHPRSETKKYLEQATIMPEMKFYDRLTEKVVCVW